MKIFLFMLRMVAVVLWTGMVHGVIRFSQIFHIAGLHARRPTRLVGLWGKGMTHIMGIKVHRVNHRTGPMGDLVISNHLGFLDIPVLLSIFPAVFVIKDEIGRIPLSGRALRNQRHIFVKRQSLSSRNDARIDLNQALESGDRVIIFPEGRGSPGAKRLPFQPYSFVAAKRHGKTVEVVALDYLPDRQKVAWNIAKPMFGQFVALLGRPRTHVSIEFLSVHIPQDPIQEAEHFKTLIEQKLIANDAAREGRDR
jgi:1-acyl-sn-glycerol-3-phosphate acyltransferase